MNVGMMTEDVVNRRVASFLRGRGFSEIKFLSGSEHGFDVTGMAPDGRRIYVESKGATSGRPTSRRAGKPFTGGQVFDHLGKQFLKALQLRIRHPRDIVAIANPKCEPIVRLMREIAPSLKGLHVRVIWVEGRSVRMT